MTRPGAKHSTLRDVAALAGVSHQTVSRVINHRPEVTPETRAKVEVAIAQLGFRPHAIARSMAQGRTCTLACLVPNLTDYTYASNMEGAESVARARGYYLLSAPFADRPQFDALIEELAIDRRVDGVIVISPYLDERRVALPDGIPAVLMAGRLRDDVKQIVLLDNRDGAGQATRHLMALGHRRIGQITGPRAEDCVQERDLGVLDALADAGIQSDSSLIVEGDWSATSGYELLKLLVAREPNLTAIFAHNDRMAVGTIRAARDLGLRVPQDLSVIGFDDMPLASYFDPPLTTVRQDTFAIGRACASLLIDLLDSPAPESTIVRLATELVVRQSTAPARGKEVAEFAKIAAQVTMPPLMVQPFHNT
jgi:DNA-binding LacI/PurR family transcriptional regulator